MLENLTDEERQILLRLAREALECAARELLLPPLELEALPVGLRALGASFVTLHMYGQLRGCVGALEPYQPLAEDVREHAVAAALQDFRFPPVREDELDKINIEISCLTIPQPLEYSTADELLAQMNPGRDGVVIKEGKYRKATFLPHVWKKIPDPAEFMDRLCEKMGSPADTWRTKPLEILVYQTEEFQE